MGAQADRTLPPGYPEGWERCAFTRDRVAYHIRPIRPDDADLERAFIAELSPESRYSRMLCALGAPSAQLLKQFVEVDYRRRMAFVAIEAAAPAHFIGIARYAEDGPATGEFAVAVLDEWQAHGIAAALSELLFAYAREHGMRVLHATMLASNRHMIELARWLGMTTRLSPDDAGLVVASRSL